MLEDSDYMGTLYGEDTDDVIEKMKKRVGKRDPPIGVSLFSGAGGFDLGMAQAGFDVRVMVEKDEQACETLELNMDSFDEYTEPEIINEDIYEVSTKQILKAAGVGVGGVTVVFGGPPCQGFSRANPNRSPEDDRNELYQEMVRVVDEAKPVYFVMENVKGLASMADGEVIKNVCEEFQQCGYDVKWDVLNAADYGVPQRRKRVFIIGKRVDVMGMKGNGRPQMHIAAKPGQVHHPEFFREKHELEDPEQTGLDAFTDEPDSVDELVEKAIQGDLQGDFGS
ncbi:DNA cytosine methyltransferase [Natrinema sp. H-ect4]|uniref:DNA cytosine methyltransferase n=1 Tax=Natrinema sp. H-ect4 TaxID=3242699 RepID=UPI0035A8C90F